jgi:hypothetical protein
LDHESVESRVGNKNVAPASQNKNIEPFFFSVVERCKDVLLRARPDERSRRAPDFQSRQGRQQNIFLYIDQTGKRQAISAGPRR